jgi:hypothetical protein
LNVSLTMFRSVTGHVASFSHLLLSCYLFGLASFLVGRFCPKCPCARDLMTEMQPEVYSIETSDMLFIREKWFAVKLYLPIHDNSDVAALL